MRLLLIIYFTVTCKLLFSQSVSIDWSHPINKKHSSKKKIQNLGQEYIDKIYKLHQIIELKDEYIDSKQKEDRIVFSVIKDDRVTLDTFRYSINPQDKKVESSFDFELPEIKGSLPKDVTTYQSKEKKHHKVGIILKEIPRHVRIDVMDEDQNIISTLVNKRLSEGDYNYEIPNNMIKKDLFQIRFFTDEYERTHIILNNSTIGFNRSLLENFWDRIIN